MKWIESSVIEETPEHYDVVSIKKAIEKASRTSYKSEEKTTEDSYERFYKMLLERKHFSPMEFGTCYFIIDMTKSEDLQMCHELNKIGPYKDSCIKSMKMYITTNVRALLENGLEKYFDDKYLVEPTYHRRRRTFRVFCSVGTSRELNRHRYNSIVERSLRYCNLGNSEKWGDDICFCKPYWFDEIDKDIQIEYTYSLLTAEERYRYLTRSKSLTPQQAKGILPLETLTEVTYCATEEQWDHFLSLRSSEAGATGQHPDANIIGNLIYKFIHNDK